MTREEKERELSALVHSGVVRDKTQLHSLLVYLGSKAIESPEEGLKEYTIGVEALGKPRDYDPRIDASVRVEIAKLRKKIAEHYQSVASDHSVRVEIPKGSYVPKFVEVHSESDPPPPTPAVRRLWLIPALAGLALLALVVVVIWNNQARRPHLAPELEAFWAPHLNGTPTLIVYGAPLFLKIQGSFYRNPDVNRAEDLDTSTNMRRVLDALQPRESRAVHTFTGVGEAEALFHITRVLASAGADLRVERSDKVGLEDLKNRHSVFLGGRKFNLQLPELPIKPKFQAVNRKIVNLEPKPGEPSEYLTRSNTSHGEITEEFALISVYPGFTPGTRLVALECSSTDGTLAAAEFVTRHDLVGKLLARGIPVRPERGALRAFQIVIGAKMNNGVVVSLDYKTHRLLN